jgi:hypothetical protein
MHQLKRERQKIEEKENEPQYTALSSTITVVAHTYIMRKEIRLYCLSL